jgi:hypothetical protein
MIIQEEQAKTDNLDADLQQAMPLFVFFREKRNL